MGVIPTTCKSLDDPPSTKDGDPDRKLLVPRHPGVSSSSHTQRELYRCEWNPYKAGNTSGDVNGGSNKHRSSRERYDWMSRVEY